MFIVFGLKYTFILSKATNKLYLKECDYTFLLKGKIS